jgi:hypothetical protein
VARHQDEVAANLTAERLRSYDIEATILSQKDRWHVVTFGGLAVIRVLVPAPVYLEAARILATDSDVGPRVA